MKGGATSGIVYPLGVCEIAQEFQFKNIGGTSAGAIAAAMTAAAEFGRQSPTGGFRRLADLPNWLATGTNLFDLFQPQAQTERLYKTLTAGFKSRKRSVLVILWAAVMNFWLWVLCGAILGLAVLAPTFRSVSGVAWLRWIPSILVFVLVGGLAGLLFGIRRSVGRTIPANFFGLCSGFGPSRDGVPPLTTWIAEQLEVLAGRSHGAPHPLTFGDLWRGPQTSHPVDEPYINLEMITTNLTHGRPYVLPLESRVWFFDPEEFRKLFPEPIVKWMVDNPPPPPEDAREKRWWELQCRLFLPLRPLPAAAQLPVVVATRMSLSFPLLLSAVPLWAVDWSRTHNDEAKQVCERWLRDHGEEWRRARGERGEWTRDERPDKIPIPAQCWFSDGGITSNFPVHFFDAPIPRWPTFGINLRPFHPDHLRDERDECANSWMARDNRGGIAEWWTDIETTRGLKSVTGFLRAIADTMQNWVDNTQLRVPGYRDRVVHISLDPGEGGLNLNMSDERIKKLSERGRCAGEKLRERFETSPPPGTILTWDNHRWVRYRTTMALIQDMAARFSKAYLEPPGSGAQSYAQLIQRAEGALPNSYRWDDEQGAFASKATEEMVGMSASWTGTGQSFEKGAPQPQPELQVRPHFGGIGRRLSSKAVGAG